LKAAKRDYKKARELLKNNKTAGKKRKLPESDKKGQHSVSGNKKKGATAAASGEEGSLTKSSGKRRK
jgi:hypothetical protein